MSNNAEERQAIREIIENWAIWRDSGEWVRFRSLWHDDGVMVATTFQGSVDEFIDRARQSHERGVTAHHILGGISIDIAGDRAVAQTRATIGQRAPVHDVVCDVVCTIRFYDLFEKRDGRWGLVRRQGIYEKDRLDPVDTSQTVSLDPEVLAQFPSGYRHLAYLQTNAGFTVKTDMPGLTGPAVDALYATGAAWLAGE
ncbi:MAG: nuclear transport factor 2 family protein [Alphaproteobacteria bacterium]|nr:nuclear transport factor 2 family protein [Alphaproteobacteria bacterium]MCZ6509671.1 nuclear transport factor 2 family protein [Alphaproteobacteria bacterium]MCZ6587456.1 nuclear transport factor 2 family protein [Alphaproteobacteria bacterium]MCZ6589669.1 nuclear transport factor 2 family protein [Alphaproteobacteria bacterium]MCZ6839215.1 nuclear transport factor 2 family protein [Alphaproteobacteria bacterium]